MLMTNDAARPGEVRDAQEHAGGAPPGDRGQAPLASARRLPDQRLDVQDAEEQAVTDFAKDMEFALVQMKADTLGLIDEALRRLEAGTYGECAECGTEIPAARLKALPFAVLCVDCQEQEETRTAEENKAVLRALPALESSLQAGGCCAASPRNGQRGCHRTRRSSKNDRKHMSDKDDRTPDFESSGVEINLSEVPDRSRHPAPAGHHPVPPRHPAAGGGARELGGPRARRGARAEGHRRGHPA